MMHELCNTLSISMQNIIENQSLNNENIPAIRRIKKNQYIFKILVWSGCPGPEFEAPLIGYAIIQEFSLR